MDFRFTTEQELWRKMVREFAEKNISPRSRAIDEEENGIPQDLIDAMVELGIFGVTIPEEYGGNAMPGEEMTYAMITVQEIARAELSMSLPVYTLLNLGWAALVAQRGSEELKKAVLPKVAKAEQFIGICVTEPQGGSDVSGITTVAQDKGDHFILNGEKAYISGVVESDKKGGGHCTLFKTDPDKGHRGMTFAYVDAKAEGVSYTVYKDMGRMGLSTGGFTYKNVKVPKTNVLGEVNRGFHMNMEGFNVARILVASACLGGAEKCLEIARDYCKQRMMFGRPLVNYEGVGFEMVNDYVQLEMTKLLLQKGAWLQDRWYAGDEEVTIPELNRTIAMCKLNAPNLAVKTATHSLKQLGAYGYTKDCPVEMALRGLFSYYVGAEGGQNIMRIIIGRDWGGDEFVPYRGS
ncbi:MAG: acyl-CoA dehydrogenase family protein [Planctomycetota bacterium]|jgi:acyl-CoA dehydrogenase